MSNETPAKTEGAAVVSNDNQKNALHHLQSTEVFWEIRSRITSIQNVLALFVDYESDKFDNDTKDLLASTRFEVWQLTRYIDNVRDISLLNAHELDKQLDFEDVNVSDVINDALCNLTMFQTNFGKRYFFFDKTPPDLAIRCDRNRFVRIFESLLINSIVYSGEKVLVMISVKTTDGGKVDIQIKDNGFGIPKADQARIFDYEFRGENAKKVDFKGMGTELYLARQILKRMNGSITFESEERAGSTFTISFRKDALYHEKG